MTYAQALLRTRNPAAYDRDEVRAAASFVLGTLDASDEDVEEAWSAARVVTPPPPPGFDALRFVAAVEGAAVHSRIERGADWHPEAGQL